MPEIFNQPSLGSVMEAEGFVAVDLWVLSASRRNELVSRIKLKLLPSIISKLLNDVLVSSKDSLVLNHSRCLLLNHVLVLKGLISHGVVGPRFNEDKRKD